MRKLHYETPTMSHQVLKLLACISLCIGLLTTVCIARPALADTVSQTPIESCSAALTNIRRNTSLENAEYPAILRFFAYQNNANLWLDAAAQCSDRYEQGIVYSAYDSYEAHQIALHSGIASSAVDTGADLDHLRTVSPTTSNDVITASISVPTDLGDSAETALAVAQDKAAFSMEVLGARSNPKNEDDFALSFRSRTNAAQFAGTLSTDPRKKVYSVQTLLKNPVSIVDPSTGLLVPTNSAVEMELGLSEVTGTKTLTSPQKRYAAAAFIRSAFYDAFILGYPTSPLPLQEK